MQADIHVAAQQHDGLGELTLQRSQKKSSRRSAGKDDRAGDALPERVLVSNTLTWSSKTHAVLRPDGRKCTFCTHTDNTLDPVSKGLGIEENCWWGRLPKDDGSTLGDVCGYCERIKNGIVKHRRMPCGRPMNSDDYKQKLGSDQAEFGKHQELVKVTITVFIDAGGNRRARINWEAVTRTVLETIKSLEMLIKKPGWELHDFDFYIETNGRVLDEKGHRETYFQGRRVVVVPDKPIVKIEFNEKVATQLREEVHDSSDNPLQLTAEEVTRNQQEIFEGVRSFEGINNFASGSLFHERSPQMPRALPLVPILPAEPPAVAACSPAFGSLPAAAHAAPSGVFDLPGGRPKAKGKAKVGGVGNAPKPAPAAKKKASAGGAVALTMFAHGAVVEGGKTETRGRKPRDIMKEFDDISAKFLAAEADDAIFWSSEMRTGMKLVEGLNKAGLERINKASCQAEVESLRPILKWTFVVHRVLTVVWEHGLGSQDFADEFDKQATALAFAPQVHVAWPGHVLWARRKQAISLATSPELYVSMVPRWARVEISDILQ